MFMGMRCVRRDVLVNRAESNKWFLGSQTRKGCIRGRLAQSRLLFRGFIGYTPRTMSIRKGGGDWEPMLLGIEPRHCKVCKEGLYRNKTFLSGGWSRCSLCDEFVHYSCLASGKVSFLKARPRICKTCRAVQEGASSPAVKKDVTPVAVGS